MIIEMLEPLLHFRVGKPRSTGAVGRLCKTVAVLVLPPLGVEPLLAPLLCAADARPLRGCVRGTTRLRAHARVGMIGIALTVRSSGQWTLLRQLLFRQPSTPCLVIAAQEPQSRFLTTHNPSPHQPTNRPPPHTTTRNEARRHFSRRRCRAVKRRPCRLTCHRRGHVPRARLWQDRRGRGRPFCQLAVLFRGPRRAADVQGLPDRVGYRGLPVGCGGGLRLVRRPHCERRRLRGGLVWLHAGLHYLHFWRREPCNDDVREAAARGWLHPHRPQQLRQRGADYVRQRPRRHVSVGDVPFPSGPDVSNVAYFSRIGDPGDEGTWCKEIQIIPSTGSGIHGFDEITVGRCESASVTRTIACEDGAPGCSAASVSTDAGNSVTLAWGPDGEACPDPR